MSIINISNIENNTELKTDFCIIGAGMSGQIIASNIANKKMTISCQGISSFLILLFIGNPYHFKHIKVTKKFINIVICRLVT